MQLGSLIGFLALVLSLYILWRIQQVVLLGFAAVVFATVINRFVRLIQRVTHKRGPAVAIAVLTILAVLVGLVALAAPPVVSQLQQLAEQLPRALEQVRSWAHWLPQVVPGQLIRELQVLSSIVQNLQDWVTQLFGNFFSVFYNTLGLLLSLLLFFFVTLMLLSNPQPYRHIFILMFPAFYRSRVDEILDSCEDNLAGWAIGMLFNMTVIGLMSGLGLWIIGVPLPLANALLAALLTFIPNLGPTISVIPPTLLGLLEAPWKAIAVIVLYVVIQQVESNILTPLVMKRQVSLLPAVTLLSLAAFGILFGTLGLFLALPIVVVAQVWLHEVLVKDILNPWQKPHQHGDTPSEAP